MSDSNPLVYCPVCKSSNVEKRGYVGKEIPKQRFVCRDTQHPTGSGRWFQLEIRYRNEPNWERSKLFLRELLGKDTYIITSAQNNTPLDKGFWRGLLALAEYYDAQILVIPLLYKNPTSISEVENSDAWWPEEVLPYLVSNELQLCKGLRLMGHLPINATAPNPLHDVESLSQGDSAVVGHPQVQLRAVATPQHSFPKLLQTTGSVSVKNYSRTKAGIKARFHHSLGAVIVEKEKDFFHMRGVVADEKSEFYDLGVHVTPEGVKPLEGGIEAIVTGDIHAIFHSADVRKATYDAPDSMTKVLKPKMLVRHDVIDSYSISHHHRGKPATNYEKWLNGTNSLESELQLTSRLIEETTPAGCENIIVASNHHDHIARWLDEVDPDTEPWNAILYHELKLAQYKSIRDKTGPFEPFAHWMVANCKVPCRFTRRSEPLTVEGILVSLHGDKGSNGARASLTGMAKMGVKTVIGHSHTPAIEKGCYRVGTSSDLDLEYAKDSPSSWLHTHCLIFPNGKRQLVNIIRGEWCKKRSFKNAA